MYAAFGVSNTLRGANGSCQKSLKRSAFNRWVSVHVGNKSNRALSFHVPGSLRLHFAFVISSYERQSENFFVGTWELQNLGWFNSITFIFFCVFSFPFPHECPQFKSSLMPFERSCRYTLLQLWRWISVVDIRKSSEWIRRKQTHSCRSQFALICAVETLPSLPRFLPAAHKTFWPQTLSKIICDRP